MNNHSLILSFSDIHAKDLPLVGGKGANLGEMTNAGLPVPSGFCLTTSAFQEFINSYSGADSLYASMDSIGTEDVETVRKVGQHIRQTLIEIPIPDNIVNAVREQWQKVGAENAYAVRSSATAEDLPDASFAGQQDTYLNIIGEESLLDAIRRCWVSLFTDRAILYRTQNNFPHREVQLSVVVQKMIMSEFSGILFTADPLTGHRHTLTIDASFGLGEALVSGMVSPDAYRVDKRKPKIIYRQIADKKMGIYPEKGGGTREVLLSEAQRKKTVLTNKQILALADMGSKVEKHYKIPQDIEWAIEKDQLYLLQARPITSLYPIDGLKPSDNNLHAYFSLGHQQNMTNAMPPLAISCMQNIMPFGRTKDASNIFFVENAAHIFLDLTPLLSMVILHKPLLTGISQLNALAPQALQVVMHHPEFKISHSILRFFSTLKIARGIISKVMHALWKEDHTGLLEQVNNNISSYIKQANIKIERANIGKERIRVMFDILLDVHHLMLSWTPPFIAGDIAKRILGKLGRKVLSPDEIEALSLGLHGNAVVEMDLALGDLADKARISPELCEWLNNLDMDSQSWLKKAATLENSADFIKGLDDFLALYGARGLSEIDITTSSWAEEPKSLLKVIASHLQQEKGSHRIREKKLIENREKATEKLFSQTKGIKRHISKRLVHVLHHAGILREHHKFTMIQTLHVIKKWLNKVAQELVQANRLENSDDIRFLRWNDLLHIWDADTDKYSKLIPERRTAFERYKKMQPPLIITSDGEIPEAKYDIKDAPAGALLGNPVSIGVYEGVVRVVRDPETETLNPGEILVTTFTDPGWTPLFINAGALILEVGGAMTHGSVVAREYGIPAVVGVVDATTKLKTGQKVRVNGHRGFIEIL